MDLALISEDLLIGAAIVGGLGGLAIALYQRSAASRKRYTCPECGERVQVELMDASRCNTCGALLRQTTKGD